MNELNSAALRGALDLSRLQAQAASTPPATGGWVFDITDQSAQTAIDLSQTVPVVIAVWSPNDAASTELVATLEKIVLGAEGRIALAKADVATNPQLVQGFGVQALPFVLGIVAGQPVPLFQGPTNEGELTPILSRLLQVAADNGVNGQLPPAGEAPAEPPLPPLHQQAFDALDAGDFDGAIAAYEQALKENPRDDDAKAGLAQVRLLKRIDGANLQAAREAAASAPASLPEQFAVADLDIAGGHVEDAFGRLLDLFPQLDKAEQGEIRERLVELFELVGGADPRVARARQRLASLLF